MNIYRGVWVVKGILVAIQITMLTAQLDILPLANN